ncbi:MAG: M6 family metalloprotease domain-containing protein, partial [Candidatus Muiribacteriota bacterium]
MKKYLICILFIFLIIHVNSAPPAPGVHHFSVPKKTNINIEEDSIQKTSSPFYTSQKSMQANPSGANNLIVIRVEGDKPDEKMDLTLSEAQDFYSDVNSYYNENSYGQCSVSAIFTDIYVLPEDLSYYGQGMVDGSYRSLELVEDAVALADPHVDFNNFDIIQVLHAGTGEETSGDPDDIWSVRYYNISIPTNDGVTISSATIVPQKQDGDFSSLGVVVHELGHDIGNLPDLYDTKDEPTNDGIGVWGVMGSGTWNGMGNSPAHFTAWSKIHMGWITPLEITQNENNVEIPSSSQQDSVIKVAQNPDNPTEYFLVENRYKTSGFDSQNPANGLLIWHIDEAKLNMADPTDPDSNNNNEAHRLVKLMEAHGDDLLDNYTGSGGTAGDIWSTTTNNTFSSESTPNSNWYNGNNSNLELNSISAVSETMTANISVTEEVVSPPQILAFETRDETASQAASFDIGETVYIFVEEEQNEEISTGNIQITDGDYDSGNIELIYEGNGQHTYEWVSDGRNSGSYSINLTLENSGGITNSQISFELESPVTPPQILTFQTRDETGSQASSFDIGETVYIFVEEEQNEEISNGNIQITGGDYNSGNIELIYEGNGQHTHEWSSQNREAQNYLINLYLENSGGEKAQEISFSLEDITPSPVTLIEPENEEFLTTYTPTFMWQLLEGQEDRYILEIAQNSDFADILYTYYSPDNSTDNHTIPHGELENDTTYHWRVYAERDGFSSPEDALIRSFNIEIDEEAPYIISNEPENQAENIYINTNIIINFNKELDEATVNTSNVYLRSGGADIPADVEYAPEEFQVILTPTDFLNYNSDFIITVTNDLMDINGNNFEETWTSEFSTQLYPSLEEFEVVNRPGDGGDYFNVSWVIAEDISSQIKEYLFYYIQKDSEFIPEDTQEATLISKTPEEVNNPVEWEINIPDSTENPYSFAVKYITEEDKSSEFAFSGPATSEEDLKVLTEAIYEVVPSTALADTRTEISIY